MFQPTIITNLFVVTRTMTATSGAVAPRQVASAEAARTSRLHFTTSIAAYVRIFRTLIPIC